MRITPLSFFVGAAILVLAGRPAQAAPTIAYHVNAPSSGNFDWADPLGLDFDVNTPVVVTRVGVFDSDQNGLFRAITFYLYDRNTQQPVVGPLVFQQGETGTLVGGNRFIDIPDVTLPAGFQGAVVAENYGPGESYYDIGGPGGAGGAGASVMNDGGGAISFVGLGRYLNDPNGANAGQYPTVIDIGPANRYSIGTFEFDVVPEPASAAWVVVTAALAALRRRPCR